MERVIEEDVVINTAEFHIDFAAMYCNSEKKAKVEAALQALKQTKLVAHYTHQFNFHAHNTGWETPTLISQYKQGLKTQVRLVLLMAGMEFEQLSKVANLASRTQGQHGLAPAHTNVMKHKMEPRSQSWGAG
jgi:hypothetical protein